MQIADADSRQTPRQPPERDVIRDSSFFDCQCLIILKLAIEGANRVFLILSVLLFLFFLLLLLIF
jgi:hypothetical protein